MKFHSLASVFSTSLCRAWRVVCFASWLTLPIVSYAGNDLPVNPPLKTVRLLVGNDGITAEIADTPQTRQIGLMGRGQLKDNQGMLFLFDEQQAHCMWMKNTPEPLDVAFLSPAGIILNIASMQALSLDTHCAMGPSTAALEMRAGWFKDHQVQAGQRVTVPAD